MAHGPWAGRTIAEMTLLASAQGQQIVNVFHFQASTTQEALHTSDIVARTMAQAMGASWWTTMASTWRALFGSFYVLNMIRTQVVERPGLVNHRLTPTEQTLSTSNGGLASAGTLESMTDAGVIRWRSALAGKSFRGRTYIGPLGAGQTDLGRLEAAIAIPAFQAFVTAQMSSYGSVVGVGPAWVQTVYSKPYNKMEYGYVKGSGPDRHWFWPEDYDGQANNVVDGSVDPILRSQRRRELGVGS